MSAGYVYILYPPLSYPNKDADRDVIHIGVGFCVARTGEVGNAKASMCGTGNRYRFPRFFFKYELPTIVTTSSAPGNLLHKLGKGKIMEVYGIALCIIILFLLLLIARLVAKRREDKKKALIDRQETNASPILAIIGDHRTIQPYLKENLDKRFILIENAEGEEGWQDVCKALKENPETCHIPIILLSTHDDETTVLKGELLYAEGEEAPVSQAKGMPEEESELISKIKQIVENNLQNPDFSVKKLSEHLNMSQPTLYRRVKEATNTTIIEQIRAIRMKRAGELLAEQKYIVQEVAELVGYNDMPTFRKHFTDFYHTTPSAFKKENKK